MRAHVIEDGIVTNTIEVDDLLSSPFETCIEATEGGIGWRWDGATLSPPLEPLPTVPASITPRQGYRVLAGYGMLEAVITYFEALPVTDIRRIDFTTAQEWRRDWQALVDAAYSFGLTDAQIDQMFIEASVL